MLDFEVQRCTRRCAETDRELQPGELFYSQLIQDGAEIVRRDYCAEAWTQPDESAVGWWKARMPQPNSQKLKWAPNDVLLHYFTQLETQPDEAATRYVLALLMVRRRLLRLEETQLDDAGNEVLVVYCQRNETEYAVPVAPPSRERATEIQEQLAKMLFADSE